MRGRGTVRASPQRRVRRAAADAIRAALGGDVAAVIVADADARYPEVAARIPRTRAGARDLLRTSAYTIALQRALVDHGLDPDDADALVSDIVYASIRPARTAVFRIAGLRSRDLLERARWGASLSRRLYYTPPDWVMDDVVVDEGFGFDVTRCVVAEFFASAGMSELCQRAICDQDLRSAAHHGVLLERSQTLSSGGDRCDFRYRASERAPSHRTSRWGRGPRCERGRTASGTITDEVEVDATAEQLWSWLASLADHYREWHPDHSSAQWVRGAPNEVGSRLRVVEDLAGHRERLVLEVTQIDAPTRMEYRIVGPHSILLPGGTFEIVPEDGHSLFRASLRYRFGPVARVVFRRRMDALRTHLREEGENLERLVEATATPSVRRFCSPPCRPGPAGC